MRTKGIYTKYHGYTFISRTNTHTHHIVTRSFKQAPPTTEQRRLSVYRVTQNDIHKMTGRSCGTRQSQCKPTV